MKLKNIITSILTAGSFLAAPLLATADKPDTLARRYVQCLEYSGIYLDESEGRAELSYLLATEDVEAAECFEEVTDIEDFIDNYYSGILGRQLSLIEKVIKAYKNDPQKREKLAQLLIIVEEKARNIERGLEGFYGDTLVEYKEAKAKIHDKIGLLKKELNVDEEQLRIVGPTRVKVGETVNYHLEEEDKKAYLNEQEAAQSFQSGLWNVASPKGSDPEDVVSGRWQDDPDDNGYTVELQFLQPGRYQVLNKDADEVLEVDVVR